MERGGKAGGKLFLFQTSVLMLAQSWEEEGRHRKSGLFKTYLLGAWVGGQMICSV